MSEGLLAGSRKVAPETPRVFLERCPSVAKQWGSFGLIIGFIVVLKQWLGELLDITIIYPSECLGCDVNGSIIFPLGCSSTFLAMLELRVLFSRTFFVLVD